jgi:hypothetical protein
LNAAQIIVRHQVNRSGHVYNKTSIKFLFLFEFI